MSRIRIERVVLLAALGAVTATVVGIAAGRTLFGFSLRPVPVGAVPDSVTSEDAPPPELRARVASLERKLAAHAPRGTYLVVDRGNNRLWVRRGDRVALEAVVSTGSRTVLRETGGQKRTWMFDTPAGRFEVRSERKDPVWVKPDWAFLEEGQPPPPGTRGRVERGSLGEWALDLGDGYMIHGTLYERLLGRSLTHGCIRVGRDDLRLIARAVGPGTRVYIF